MDVAWYRNRARDLLGQPVDVSKRIKAHDHV